MVHADKAKRDKGDVEMDFIQSHAVAVYIERNAAFYVSISASVCSFSNWKLMAFQYELRQALKGPHPRTE